MKKIISECFDLFQIRKLSSYSNADSYLNYFHLCTRKCRLYVFSRAPVTAGIRAECRNNRV